MFRFSGPITMGSASASLAECVRAIDAGETEFALDGLDRSDSSALSVLLEAVRRARARGVALRFSAMPPKLASLATLYGVDAMLGTSR